MQKKSNVWGYRKLQQMNKKQILRQPKKEWSPQVPAGTYKTQTEEVLKKVIDLNDLDIDISAINQKLLIKVINDGNKELIQYNNLLTHLVQPKPNTLSWALWDLLLQSYTIPNSTKLKDPLGEWKSNHIKYSE